MSDAYSPADVARQLDYCTFCPKLCRHACPVSNADAHEVHIPQAKMDRLNQLRRGRMPWTEETAEPLWACTGCRQCTTFCDHENEPGLVLLAGRAEANARGAGHPNLAGYPDRFRNRDRRLARTAREHFGAERFADDAVIGFWPGCDAIDKGLADVGAALRLFSRVGVDQVRLVDAEQVCAGYPLLAAGYPDMFRWHAKRVQSSLQGVRTLIVNCSACVHTLRAQYPAEGIPLAAEILSIPEFLARAVTKLPPPEKKRVVYYHDPCYLARYAGVLEAPRRVLARVAELRDFSWSHTDTECCGGAGLLPKTMPETADAMARRRLRDISQRGGGTVVTACATCSFMLKRNAPDGVTVHDLPGFLEDVVGTLPKP